MISFSVSVKRSPVAGLSTSTAQASVPEVPVRGSSRLNIASSTGVGAPAGGGSAPSCSQRQRSTAAMAATTPGNSRGCAVRRERHLEGTFFGHGGQRVELQRQPGGVVGAQVHRQRLGQRAQAARLLGAVDPDLEGFAPRRRIAVGRQFADEEREVAMRVLHHVGPGRVAGRQLGPAGPAQAGQHRLRARSSARRRLASWFGVGLVQPQRLRRLGRGVTLSTEPSTALGR